MALPQCRPSSAPCWPAQTLPAHPRGRWAHRSPRRNQPPAGPKGGTAGPPMGGPRLGLMVGGWFISMEWGSIWHDRLLSMLLYLKKNVWNVPMHLIDSNINDDIAGSVPSKLSTWTDMPLFNTYPWHHTEAWAERVLTAFTALGSVAQAKVSSRRMNMASGAEDVASDGCRTISYRTLLVGDGNRSINWNLCRIGFWAGNIQGSRSKQMERQLPCLGFSQIEDNRSP